MYQTLFSEFKTRIFLRCPTKVRQAAGKDPTDSAGHRRRTRRHLFWSSFVMETFGKVDIYGLDPTRVSLIMAHCRIRKGGVWMFQNYYVFFEIYLVNFWCLRTIMFFSEIYSWEMFAWFDPLVYLKIFTVTWFAKCCCHVKHIPDVMPFCQSHICQVNGMHGKDNTP